MAISFEKAIGLPEAALKLRADRAGVISSNLANADTPGYKARDLDFHQAFAAQTQGKSSHRMAATQEGHIGFSSNPQAMRELSYRTPHQPSVDGNTVEENIEHAEFMKNDLEFQIAFTMLNGSIKGLSKAIRGE